MAKGSGKVTDIDRGYKKLKQFFTDMAGESYVRVGVLGDVKDEHAAAGDEFSSVAIGLVHEFGSEKAGIPERSWLRSAVDKHRGEMEATRLKLLKGVVDGKLTAERALGLMGAQLVGFIKAGIVAGIAPENAPSVKARKEALGVRKGPVVPLIDTSRFFNSITWQVVIGGKPVTPSLPGVKR